MKDNNHENDQHDPNNNEEPKKPSREEGNLDSFLEHIHSLQGKFASLPMLKVQPVSTWLEEAKQRPIPKKLFSEFWLEGELCMLFADTNVGKSILAVQLAQSISSGEAIAGFELEATPQRVLYVDFELSDKQLEARYSAEFSDHYEFSSDFLRAELEAAVELGEEEGRFEQLLYRSLEEALERHQVQVLIIDNITYLRSETERARHALPLMKQLKS
ncbi:MAG: AAA family ATPase [Roseivirga sp.]